MAWTSMHFAVGMACTGAAAGLVCLLMRKGWRWVPALMTLGGFWALVPDMPRVFREDFPTLGFAHTLGSRDLEIFLHKIGNLFFFHASLDAQPLEYALHGLFGILILYNISLAMLMVMEHRSRNSVGNRAWRAHEEQLKRRKKVVYTETDRGQDPVLHRIRSSHLSRSA
ncbi:MAG: hypothetical protein GC164_09425 [Phycisphaera sp.]|nr:hypothetical protein [Phycisphaera sp.]